jgi:hypothetical protein
MTVDGAIFIVVLVIALALFSYALVRRLQLVMVGRPEWRFDRPLTRTAGFFVLVFGQKKLFKEKVGLIHFFVFWGFIVIAFGTLQILAEGIRLGFVFPWSDSYGFNMAKDILRRGCSSWSTSVTSTASPGWSPAARQPSSSG